MALHTLLFNNIKPLDIALKRNIPVPNLNKNLKVPEEGMKVYLVNVLIYIINPQVVSCFQVTLVLWWRV